MTNCYLSTSLCRNKSIQSSIIDCGYLSNKYIELSAPHPNESIDEVKKIIKNFLKEGYKFTLHNYFPPPNKSFVLNIASDEDEVIASCKELINNALQLSIVANSKVYGIHAGYLSKAIAKENGMFEFNYEESSYSNSLDYSIKFINSISKNFEKNNVKLIIENLFPSIARNSSLFCSLEQIDDLMKQVPQSVGLLLDLGHLNISSNIMKFSRDKFLDQFLKKYGHRLYEVHISENNGFKDEHRALEKESWQFDALKKISDIKVENNTKYERIYCLESRNAKEDQIISNLKSINEILS
jgi:sugar phosphate isomerase/epimerase